MKCKTAKNNYMNSTSRGPRRASTLLAQMADLERGERIKALRNDMHLTQPVVADRCGVTLRAYQEWEAGGGIQWENAKRLAKVLGSNPDFIMRGPPLETPDPFKMLAGAGEDDKLDRLLAEVARLTEVVELLAAAVAPAQFEAWAKQWARTESPERGRSGKPSDSRDETGSGPSR